MNTSILSLGADAQRQAIEQIGKQNRTIAEAEPRRKFGNATVVVDGFRFDSKRESIHYLALKAEQARGDLSDLRIQPAWRIEINGELICDYVADFAYVRLGAPVVEDVKSKATRTRDYLIKKKLMRAVHHIEVREVA